MASLISNTTQGDEPPLPKADQSVRLIFTGDIMLDMIPGAALSQGVDPFAPYGPVFKEADFVVGNLECVVATGGQQFDKLFTFKAHPRTIPTLEKWFDALSIANNHTGDFGDEGLLEEIKLFSGKVPLFGGGKDLAEARKPLIVERNGVRIALLGYNEFFPSAFAAGENDPGIAWSRDEHVVADIRAAREQHRAHVVLPFLHWGWEQESEPNDRQKQFARTMIDAGASAVIGGHPHVTQGAEIYKGRPIVYSLGNFVFDGFETPESTTGWVLRMTVDLEGVAQWDTVVHDIDFLGTPTPDWNARGPAGERGRETLKTKVPRRPAIRAETRRGR
jgi:poly-gamma-glutamate synthesis protein (capsule biosynthesis protein)